ncbi:hypothetical protein DFH06DRAFT_709610 [Mycena polygramma]|nr:hypothetical protein DFH06DRAFT_709610 [Mycena polygramma]
MTAPNSRRLARIGTEVSIAEVFGVGWVFDLASSAHNVALEAWKSCLRSWSADLKRCVVCDEELWAGDLVSCSNDEDRHWFCLQCFENTTTAMITGDVAFSYDPRTMLPLCCYCIPPSSSTLDTRSLSPQLRRSWDKAIIARQLQALGLPLITCAHCSYVVVDEREEPAPPTIPATGSLRRRLAQTLSSYLGSSPIQKPARFHCPECDFLTCLPPHGCGVPFRPALADTHKCRTDNLRLEIERAVVGLCLYLSHTSR